MKYFVAHVGEYGYKAVGVFRQNGSEFAYLDWIGDARWCRVSETDEELCEMSLLRLFEYLKNTPSEDYLIEHLALVI